MAPLKNSNRREKSSKPFPQLRELALLPLREQKTWERKYHISPAAEFDVQKFIFPIFVALLASFSLFFLNRTDGTSNKNELVALNIEFSIQSSYALDKIGAVSMSGIDHFFSLAKSKISWINNSVDWRPYNPLSRESMDGLQEGFAELSRMQEQETGQAKTLSASAISAVSATYKTFLGIFMLGLKDYLIFANRAFDLVIGGVDELPLILKDARAIVRNNGYRSIGIPAFPEKNLQKLPPLPDKKSITILGSGLKPIDWKYLSQNAQNEFSKPVTDLKKEQERAKKIFGVEPSSESFLSGASPQNTLASLARDWKYASGGLMEDIRESWHIWRNISEGLVIGYKNSSALVITLIAGIGSAYQGLLENVMVTVTQFLESGEQERKGY